MNRTAAMAAVPSARPSASSILAIAPRPAPSAARRAISFCLRVARMSNSVATLPQATRSTSAAAALTARSAGRTAPTCCSCADTTLAVQSGGVSGVPVLTSAVIRSAAALGVTPGWSRTM